ncbi:hypothetical protein ABG067_004655 [Albugo candida]
MKDPNESSPLLPHASSTVPTNLNTSVDSDGARDVVMVPYSYAPLSNSSASTTAHTQINSNESTLLQNLASFPLFRNFTRSHSFPNELFTGTRFSSRFELEQYLRTRHGTGNALSDWLYTPPSHHTPIESDDEKKLKKAQHLESFDYDFYESRVNLQHDHEQTEEMIRSLNLGRWLMTFSIGLVTAFLACFVEIATKYLSSFRTNLMESYIKREATHSVHFGVSFFLYSLCSVTFVFIASYCVAILCPVAIGSGISEIKATLNGIKIHRVVRFKTLFCKAFGILFSVAGGLPGGKEGPMIHSGAVIGAGLSQGKSSSFGIDTSWTKFKGFRNDKEKRDFISCGAAAGVAAAFGAPIGGVLFALEEGASFWHQNLTWRTFFCAMVSAFVFNLFLSFVDPASEEVSKELDTRVFIGVLGTQTGTFSFGPFNESKAYDVLDLVYFIGMGMLGGVFGAAFNHANTLLTKFRIRMITNRWIRLSEALLLAFCMSIVSFWLPYFFGICRPVDGPYASELVQMYCPEGEFNDLASLFTISYSTSIKQLLHFTTASSFSSRSLLIFFGGFYTFACWTYGVAVPSGLFVPSLLAGAAFGRLCVMFLHWLAVPVVAPDGMFALIGAASMLGGMARMTISLTVIILECTGVIEWGLPIMLCLMAARWVGNTFNEGLYDIHLHLKKLPFLEYDPPYYSRFLRAENIMSKPAVCVPHIAKVGEIYAILKQCQHGGFPVVLIDHEKNENELKKKAKAPRFAGIIYRRHLCVLLQRKDFFVEKPAPFTRKPAGETTLLYNDQYALSYRDIESSYPRYPTIEEIKLDRDEQDLWMDLTPYLNPTPHTVQEQTPVPRAFRLYRSLGLRHLVVLNRRNEVCGIITRKDLTPAHLKACLEGLSEKEKQKIQGYFRRGRASSERFEDVERALLNLVDNS